jgi:hypothetical protein
MRAPSESLFNTEDFTCREPIPSSLPNSKSRQPKLGGFCFGAGVGIRVREQLRSLDRAFGEISHCFGGSGSGLRLSLNAVFSVKFFLVGFGAFGADWIDRI